MTIRWGIIGTGGIARKMVETLASIDEAALGGVASHTPARARDFAATNSIAAFDSIEEMVGSGQVDVVYVGTNHSDHHSDVSIAVAAGVPVLCEKAFAPNAAQASSMIASARKAGVFLMEAMWMRFLPFWDRLQELVGDGVIGELRTIHADFGFPADPDPDRRWLNPGLGGGALLDLGIYPVTLAVGLSGLPEQVTAIGELTATGVDGSVAIGFRHPGGVVSALECSVLADTSCIARVSGSSGRLVLEAPFHHTSRIALWRDAALIETFDTGFAGTGYQFEVAEVHRCLREGATESLIRPLDHTLEVMHLLDRIRATAFAGE